MRFSEHDDDHWVRVRESVIDDGEARIKDLEDEVAKVKAENRILVSPCEDSYHCSCVVPMQNKITELEMTAHTNYSQYVDLMIERDHLRSCLKRLEWVSLMGVDKKFRPTCPACMCPERLGHAPDCWLAKELEGK